MSEFIVPQVDEMESMLGMGTINGRAVLRTLNSKVLTPTEVFLREAVQNSFDAKKEDAKHINFTLRAFRFTEEQYQYLTDVFPKTDKAGNPSFFVRNVKRHLKPDMINLEVTDTNTLGLIGTAGIPEGEEAKSKRQNFYNFVYGTGNDKDVLSQAGGSYGFGKAALYLYSQARTIIIYSRTKTKTGYKSKLIIVANIENVSDNGADRCWWGKRKEYEQRKGEYIAPYIGVADRMAEALGFSPFGETETGTKLLLLNAGPTYSDTRSQKTFERIFKEDIPKYLVHWYWPKIHTDEIKFKLLFENQEIEIDTIEETYPYNVFAKALDYSNSPGSNATRFGVNKSTYRKVEWGASQKISVGTVALKETVETGNAAYSDLIDIFNTNLPVIACMRAIGHIVYYYQVPISIGNVSIHKNYYGLFRVDPKAFYYAGGKQILVDNYFREMENTTHDEWGHNSGIPEFPHNFIKQMKETCLSMCESLIIPNIDDDDENVDLSVLIQRALGEKLKLNSNTTTGGAGIVMEKSTVLKDSNPSEKKSTITTTGLIDVENQNGKKVLKIQCRVKIKDGKALSIDNVEFDIRDIDGKKVEAEKTDLIYRTVISEKLESNDITLNLENCHGEPKLITRGGIYNLYVESNTECAFTVKINTTEVTA